MAEDLADESERTEAPSGKRMQAAEAQGDLPIGKDAAPVAGLAAGAWGRLALAGELQPGAGVDAGRHEAAEGPGVELPIQGLEGSPRPRVPLRELGAEGGVRVLGPGQARLEGAERVPVLGDQVVHEQPGGVVVRRQRAGRHVAVPGQEFPGGEALGAQEHPPPRGNRAGDHLQPARGGPHRLRPGGEPLREPAGLPEEDVRGDVVRHLVGQHPPLRQAHLPGHHDLGVGGAPGVVGRRVGRGDAS